MAEEQLFDVDVVETYVPIRNEANHVVGSFEVYVNVTEYRQQIRSAVAVVATALLVVLAGASAVSYRLAIGMVRQAILRLDAEQALRKETEEKMQAVEELREKDQLLIQQSRLAEMGEMIGNIAHQWRQPLNNLALLVQQLQLLHQSGELSGEVLGQNVAKSMQVIQHMSKTISDFSGFFRPDKARCDFCVATAIRKTISLLDSGLACQGITVEIKQDGAPTIHGFENEFAQVALVIVQNARDAFAERKVTHPLIEIKIGVEAGRTITTFADNAGGVPEAIIDRIFEPYFTTKDAEKGTGVGLFMSKMIIEKNMGGRLTVSNVAEGAVFRIEI